jgi:hypothetical protein
MENYVRLSMNELYDLAIAELVSYQTIVMEDINEIKNSMAELYDTDPRNWNYGEEYTELKQYLEDIEEVMMAHLKY